VRLSGGESGAGNIHAAWLMAVAMRAAEAYAGNRNLTALAVAGSVGAGLADRFSDLELDCYWVRPPTVTDHVAPVHALGGELPALWDYDEYEKEWSEEYRVGELDITVSNFLASAVEQFLDDVVLRASTDPVRHMRLAPERLAERLASMSADRPGEALQAAEALLAEIVTLAEAHSDADIGAFRMALSERRRPIDPALPDT